MIPPRSLALGSAALLLAGLSAGVPRPVERRDEKEVERLLSLPISPGSVALLVEDSRLPAVADRWTAALADPRPAVRGAAARAINVTGLAPLRSALEQALRAEDAAEAAREEMRALATIAGAEGRPLLLETASRFDGRLDAALFETLARTGGRAALPVYFSSPKPRLTPAERRGFFTVASQGDAATLSGAGSMALGRQDRPSWNAVLEAAKGLDLEPSVLGVALASPDAEIAADTAWRLASRCSMRPCPAADALRSALETQKPWPNVDERFSRELLARALGGSARESAEWIDSLLYPEGSRADGLTSEDPALRLLTRAELAALNRRRRTIAGITTLGLALRAPSSRALRQDRHIRTLSGLPRGLTADLLSIIGCATGGSAVGGAEITYGADGRPRSVKLVDAHAPAACSRAARSLFMLSLSPAGQLSYPGEPDIVVVVFQPDCAAAFDELASATTPGDNGPLTVGGAVQAPVLTKKTEPLYPEEALKGRVSGLVVLEAVVDERGCVTDVRVMRNADPRLDLAALYAVARWRYSPATLRGEPVRVFLTVTVTFKAH